MHERKKLKIIIQWLILPSLLLASCYKEGSQISDNKTFAADSITEINVSYENYMQALIKKNCSTCHGKNGSAETYWLNENSYENILQYAVPVTHTLINKTMPPPPKFPFTKRDVELIRAWMARGSPRK